MSKLVYVASPYAKIRDNDYAVMIASKSCDAIAKRGFYPVSPVLLWGDVAREIHKGLDKTDTLNSPLNKINPLIAIPEMLNRAVGNEPSKKESDKERLARPNIAKEHQEVLDRAYHTDDPNAWNIAGNLDFLAPAEFATFAVNAPIKTGGTFVSRLLPNFYKNGLVATATDLPQNVSDSKNLGDFGVRAGLGFGFGGLLGTGIGEIANKTVNRGLKNTQTAEILGSSPSMTQKSSRGMTNQEPNAQNAEILGSSPSMTQESSPSMTQGSSRGMTNSEPNSQTASINESLIKGLDDDLATNGSRVDGSTPPPSGGGGLRVTSEQAKAMRASNDDGLVRGDGFVTDPKSAKQMSDYGVNVSVEDWVKELGELNNNELSANLFVLQQKHPEFFEKPSDVYRTILEIKNNPTHFFKNNRPDMALIAKRLEDNSLGKMGVVKDSGKIGHLSKSTRDNELTRLQRINTEQFEAGSPYPTPVSSNKLPQHGDGANALSQTDERMRALSAVSSRKAEQGGGLPNENIAQKPLKTADDADIIDLVPDENGVHQVAFNGSSKELTKIATELAKGEIKSAGAKKLIAIAENGANEVAGAAEQIISANIAKINDSSIEIYANNINILNEVAKKYPMLSKSEQIELANKQIMANASPELLGYTRAINGGELPSDPRMLGTNASRMVAKSLELGATPAEVRDMLLKAGIKADYATALAKQLKSRDINAFNDSLRASEQRLLNESVESVRTAVKNESVGAILDSAKEQAIKNDALLKKGVGNQSLDDEITRFKNESSGKEFEVAENGFGRELMKYEGKEVNDDAKRAFSAWEAQGDKADITLGDGRKVVYLSPDEAVELSYGNGYLYGAKDYAELMARKKTETPAQRLERLQSHPAYENLLKMRENTKADPKLKADTRGGSKPSVYYDEQSDRYLRTKGGGGFPNSERSINITKSDVAKLRAGKADESTLFNLETSLEALTGDPYANALVDHLLTRDYHLASAAKKSELVAPKVAENISDFSPSGSWKAGYTSIKGKSATGNSRISDEAADDSVKKNKAKIETDPAKVKNSIGAIFGDSIDEKASKAIIKAVEGADGLDAKKFAFKKGILENTTKPFEVKGKPYEVSDKSVFKLREDLKSLKGTKLYHSGVEFVVGSRFTGRVSGAEAKAYSAKNNFSEVEHLTIANNIKEVFENSTFIAKRKGFKDRDRANNLFFISDVAIKNGDEVKQSRALITLKESLDDKGKRVYSIELDIAPSNIKGGEVPNAKSEIQPVNVEVATNHTSPENLAKNSTPNEIKSQGEIKWGEKLKAKMAKMGQEYSDEKIANLANWHKNSHAVTKEKDGSPKVFYHTTTAKEPFGFFDYNKQYKNNPIGHYFFNNDTNYGDGIKYKVYLKIKKPFIHGELTPQKQDEIFKIYPELKQTFENMSEKGRINLLKNAKRLSDIFKSAKKLGFENPKIWKSTEFFAVKNGKYDEYYDELPKTLQNKIRLFANNASDKIQAATPSEYFFNNLSDIRYFNKKYLSDFENNLETYQKYLLEEPEITYFRKAEGLYDNFAGRYGEHKIKVNRINNQERLKSFGYDGVQFSDTEFVAFSPNQIKSIDNNGAFNPRSKMMRGFSIAEMPSAILGGAGGHMAGSAVGAVAGEYESEGGVAGAIIGALAGLASPKAAAKIAAKMMSKKANRLDLTKLSQQEKDLVANGIASTLKTKTPAKEIKMSVAETKAIIDKMGLNGNNIEAHIKNTNLHSQKDIDYRMSKFALIPDTIKDFDIKGIKGSTKTYIKFWQDENSNIFAHVVTKENDGFISNYIPLHDISKVEKKIKGFDYVESPSHTENSKLGTDGDKSRANEKNYTTNKILSQGQVPKGWMKGATNIASTNEKPKWADKLKAKMAKMGQEYSDEMADDGVWAYDKPNAYNAKFSDIVDSSKADELFEALAKESDQRIQSTIFKEFSLSNRIDEFSPSGKYVANENAKTADEYRKIVAKKYKDLAAKSVKKQYTFKNGDGEFAVNRIARDEMVSGNSIANTIKDKNFKWQDHFTAVENADEIFKNSKKLAYRKGLKTDDSENITYYVSDTNINGRDCQVLFTLKEKVGSGENKIYTLEVDLKPSDLKARGSGEPSLVENKRLHGEDTSNTADLNSNAKNSSANEIKSQGIKELTNAKSVLNDESRKALKEIANSKTADASSVNDAKARLTLDKHRADAEKIAKEKGANSPEYQKAKNFADDFEVTWFEKDGSPKLCPSPCRG